MLSGVPLSKAPASRQNERKVRISSMAAMPPVNPQNSKAKTREKQKYDAVKTFFL